MACTFLVDVDDISDIDVIRFAVKTSIKSSNLLKLARRSLCRCLAQEQIRYSSKILRTRTLATLFADTNMIGRIVLLLSAVIPSATTTSFCALPETIETWSHDSSCNGPPQFESSFCADHVSISNGSLACTVDAHNCKQENPKCAADKYGGVQIHGPVVGFGNISVIMQVAKGDSCTYHEIHCACCVGDILFRTQLDEPMDVHRNMFRMLLMFHDEYRIILSVTLPWR